MIGLLVDIFNFLKSCIATVFCGVFCVVVSQEHKDIKRNLARQQMVLVQQGLCQDFLTIQQKLKSFYCNRKGRTFVHRAVRYNQQEVLKVCGGQPWWDCFVKWFAALPKKQSLFVYASRYNSKYIRLLLELGFIISDEDKKELVDVQDFLGLCILFAYGVSLPMCENVLDEEIINGWKRYQESKDLSAFFKTKNFEFVPFEDEDLQKNDGWITVHAYLWLFAACSAQDMRACMHIYNNMLDGERAFLYQSAVAQPLLQLICLKSPQLLTWAFCKIWPAWDLKKCLALVSDRYRDLVMNYKYKSNFLNELYCVVARKKFLDVIVVTSLENKL